MAADDASCTKLNNPERGVQNSRGHLKVGNPCANESPGAAPAGWRLARGRPDVQLWTCPACDTREGVSWSGDDLVKPTEPELEAPPTVCPFCRSARISIPNEKISASTYWRCDACGQMWNVKRHTASLRSPYDRRWNS